MSQSARVESVAQAEPPGKAPGADRPVLFLHIPKTAGTSFLLALRNLFGDARVLRLNAADPTLARTIAGIVADRLDQVSCLAGHLPVHLLAPYLDRFRPFTLLREPVARVFSLYRFLRHRTGDELARVGLGPGFTFEEFIASRNHELFGQVNNGMCRMLCGDAQASDPNATGFWRIDPDAALAERALATLAGFDFGLVEDMAATWTMLQARWNLPYALDDYVENATVRDDAEETIARVQMVIRRNMLDLALYRRADALFRTRAAVAGIGDAAASTLFAPALNEPAAIADIPGRQGFHEAEPEGFAWLRADRPARIHFAAPARVAGIRLTLYCVTDDYPIERIVLRVNGKRAQPKAERSDAGWCTLEVGPLALRREANELAIDPPMFLSVREYKRDSRDQRYLSVALSTLTILG